jgi:hypothetical protein
MAQSYVTQDGVTLIDPGTVVSLTVQTGQAGQATAGVVTLIGEANQGPGFLDEPNLSLNSFSPSQLGAVVAKYGSGNIVDAFSKLISAANDPNILGAVSLVYIVKTNMSQPSAGKLTLDYQGAPTYATVDADSQGAQGNLIQYQSAVAVAEVAPNTGLIDYVPISPTTLNPSPADVLFAIRANGGPAVNVTVTVKEGPDSLVSAIQNIPQGILATGGQQLLVAPATITLSAAPIVGASVPTLLVTLASPNLWANAPQQGDVAVIPISGDYGSAQTSAIAGAANANAGTYIVQSVTNTSSTATMTLQAVSTLGTLVSASGSVHTDMTDLILYTQIQIQNISGTDRMFMTGVYGTYNVTLNNGTLVTITVPNGTQWNATPIIGDNIKIPTTTGGVNAGFYQVTASSSTSVTITRLSEGSSGSGPNTFSYSAGAEPITCLSQYQLTGEGKTLSFEGNVSSIFLTESGADAGLSNSRLISAAEYSNQMTIIQGTNSAAYQGGGQAVLEVGYEGNLATVTINSTSLVFAVNAVTQFTATFAQYPTMGQLASYIDSQTGWSANVPSAQFNNQNTSNLDQGTYSASSSLPDVQNLRLKQDAFAWETAVNAGALVTWTTDKPGLPEPSANAFMSGGTLGGTTSAAFAAAVDATQKLTTNFIVPLFSQNAALDIPLGLTDPSSTYTIDSLNEYLLSNVLLMSELTMKSNRMAIGSKLGTFPQLITAAGELSSYRFGLAFEPVQSTNASAQSVLFQPWMAAVVAAGMQAAAGYKGIVKKFANINGIGTVPGFDSTVPGNRIAALQAGLLFMEVVPTGGFRWVSDQTTYNVDNNFVYNSIQAVYVSDLISLALIDRFDRSVAGKSVADISATAALGILEAEMFNYKRLKWIAPSSDAPKGYKNAVADLVGVGMVLSAEIKLAGLIYFVPISLLASQVTQTATQA